MIQLVWRHQKIAEKSLTMPKKLVQPNLLSSNDKSFKNYGSQKWYPLEAPEITFLQGRKA